MANKRNGFTIVGCLKLKGGAGKYLVVEGCGSGFHRRVRVRVLTGVECIYLRRKPGVSLAGAREQVQMHVDGRGASRGLLT